MPGNIEVVVNTTAYFLDSKTFDRAQDESTEQAKVISKIVDRIWIEWDKDQSGSLDKAETREFLKYAMKDFPQGYDDSKFDETFNVIDTDGDGLMDKQELAYFIKSLLKKKN